VRSSLCSGFKEIPKTKISVLEEGKQALYVALLQELSIFLA
jgi:hypothetical protein